MPKLNQFRTLALGGFFLSLTLIGWHFPLKAEENAAAARLAESLKFLSDDKLQGRGVETEGINQAADYIAEQFRSFGLNTELYEGKPFQEFPLTLNSEPGPSENNRLTLLQTIEGKQEPQRTELKLGTQFNTLALGGSAEFNDLPLVFAGYGITAKKQEYDDYAGLDVKGKAVLILRKEPQQGNPHSAFDGTKASRHAPFTSKISNAFEHGAQAVILVNDNYDLEEKTRKAEKNWLDAISKLQKTHADFLAKENPTREELFAHVKEVDQLSDRVRKLGDIVDDETDQVLGFFDAGSQGSRRTLPVFFASRASIDPVVKASLGKSLAELETEIDRDLKPRSQELTGVRIAGESKVVSKQVTVKNVIAVLEGEGPHAEETIVVGAHYDHVGLGGQGSGSLAPWTAEIHNGADDNASGTSALIEIARRLAESKEKLPRRVVFIAFTGEERGLLGSAHYVREPRFPLDKTVAMVNMDMVGRLKDNKLIIYGTKTADQFDGMIDTLNEKYKFDLTRNPGGFGPSDHASFYAKQIPVLHYFTGLHDDYHRPSDDFDKVNYEGMSRITDMVVDTVLALATAAEPPKYASIGAPRVPSGGGDRPYFGSIPDFSQENPAGFAIMGVAKEGPAEKAGLKAGDVIVKFGESKIGNLEDFDSALRKFKEGDKVPVVIKREGKEQTLEVILDAPRG